MRNILFPKDTYGVFFAPGCFFYGDLMCSIVWRVKWNGGE